MTTTSCHGPAVRLALTLLAVLPLACGREGDATEKPARGPAGSSAPATLRFCAIPDQNETLLRQKFDPVATYLSKQLGVPVEYVHATSYPNAVDLFKNGDVQLAWFGGLTGVQARAAVPGARAIVQGVEDPRFYSYFIAHKDTGLERSDEFPTGLAGLKFTFGSSDSTSGRLMPEYFIRKHTGKSPAELFGMENHYSDSHDETCKLVEAGTFQVGAVNYKVYDRRVKEGQTDPDVCRVIWQTPVYPDYNFTAHPVLEETFGKGFTEKLQKALIGMKEPALLSAFPREGLVAAGDSDFEPVRELAVELGFLRK